MNRSIYIGLGCAIVLFKFGLFGETSPKFFMDVHALVVVGVGTLTAAFFSAPPGRFLSIFTGAAKMLFVGKPSDQAYISSVIADALEGARAAKQDRNQLAAVNARHPFLKEGFGLVAEGLLNEDEIYEVMSRRREMFKRTYMEDAKTLQIISKFPPAFGLLGAVTGMIGMMSHLQGESDRIGQSMAVALVATFWGICLANVVLLPLADYYRSLADADALVRQIIIDATVMIKRKEPTALVQEKLNSYLTPDNRSRSGGSTGFRRAG